VLSEYASVTRNILSSRYERIDAQDGDIFDRDRPKPLIEPAVSKDGNTDILSASLSRRPILLIGDVGVGKTSFIRNLIKVEAKDIFDNAISIHVDLGKEAVSPSDIKDFVVRVISEQLRDEYGIDTEERDFVRGVYHGDLQRMKNGIYKDLYESNISLYRNKEIEKLESLMEDRSRHIQKCIYQIVHGHRRQVVLFVDNADQRSIEVQERAFIVSNDIASNWDIMVFMALRPETYYTSLKTGALSGYHPKAFTISPPSVTNVIKKRLKFALKISRGEVPLLNNRGISSHLNLHKLMAIIESFYDTLNQNRELPTSIYNVSGGNVRMALDLVSQFFGSGHVDTEKISDIYINKGSYYVPMHEFMRAIIFGDCEYYDPSISPIGNLFDISAADYKEHFIGPLSLSFMASRSRGETSGFVETKYLYDEIQSYGFTPDQVYACLERLYRKGLITTAGRLPVERSKGIMPNSLRISTIGAYHVNALIKKFEYIDAIIVSTPILERDVRKQVTAVDNRNIHKRLVRAEIFIKYLNDCWHRLTKSAIYFDWPKIHGSIKDNIKSVKIKVSQNR
jgi:hypothetical protein